MSIWLLISPALLWLLAGTWGASLLRRSGEDLWRSAQIFSTTGAPSYDAGRWQHRSYVYLSRAIGCFLIAAAFFSTLMSILVAVGLVPPASN